MKVCGKFIVATLVCLLAAGTVMAQSTSGGIQGTVFDEAGQALPGVTGVISSEKLQGTKTAVTNADGKFRFVLLPPGTYKAVFSLPGYQTVEQENIRVSLETVITVDVSMSSAFTEEVLVTGDAPVVDVTSAAIGSQFGEEIMANVPVGRDFTSVAYLATGAVDGGGIANDAIGNNPSIMGASALENRYVVDELDTTDAAEGRAGTSISSSFIEEVQVKTGGYNAEYGGALGGVVNMITKSGGNEFHGDVFGYFSNDSLWSTALIPETRGDVKTVDTEFDLGFTLGGKLIQDKLWYFVGYNPNSLDQNVLKDVYSGDELIQRNQLIRTYEKDYFSGKLTWQLNEANSLTANVIGDPTEVGNNFTTTNYVNSPFAETDMTYDEDTGGINYGLSFNSIFSESMFFEATLGHHSNQQQYVPHLDTTNYQDQTADGTWTNGAGGSVFFGGSGSQQPKDDRTRDMLRGSFTWFLGDNHEVKLGGGYNSVEYDMLYDVTGPSPAFCVPTIPGGAYEYDFFTGTYPQVPDNCDANGDGTLDGYSMPARLGNRYRLRGSYFYNRNYKNESTGETTEYNLYIQDNWRIGDFFTLQLGLRAEDMNAQGNLTKIMPERQLEFGFSDMLAPRVGFVWDFAKNGRSKVYAHYGKFYQAIPLTINVRSFGNENYDFYYYEYPDSGLPNAASNPGTLTYIYRSSSELTFLDPDIKPQYLEEYVFGAEYEVVTDIAVGIKYVSRSLGRVIEDISVDGGQSYFITNPGGTFTHNPTNGVELVPPVDFPEASRDFSGIEVSLNKRFSNNWQLYTSLMWSELKGNYEGLYSRDNRQIDPNITSKFDLPDLLDNADGMLQNDREWQFKAYGSYHFDFGLVTGVNMFFLTGNPVSKLGAHPVYGLDERFVTQRGSEGRTEDWLNFDLHFAYPFAVGDFTLEAMVDVFNIFDEQVAVEVDQRWSVYGPGDEGDAPGGDIDAQTNDTWGEPLVFSPPRNIRLGLKFSW